MRDRKYFLTQRWISDRTV